MVQVPAPLATEKHKPRKQAAPAPHQRPPRQLKPKDTPAQQNHTSPRPRIDAKAAEKQPHSRSAGNKTSKLPDKAAAHSKPAKATTRSVTPPRQDQQSSIAAEHQPAADFLISLGFPYTRVAYFFQRMPQLGALAPHELQPGLMQ